MRLKVITTSFLVLGLAMLIGWPFVLGKPVSKEASVHAKRVYLARTGVYFIALVGVFCTTSVLCLAILRKQRNEFKTRAGENVKILIEETLHDYHNKQ